ncbi:hypothetical protein Tsubulata_032563, partial [Turnera subulata]
SINFSTSAFWVHVHGLIPEQLDESNAKCIGECLGTFLDLDLSTDNGICRNDVMRIKVELDVMNPLMPGIKNTRPDGSSMWLRLKYERLPGFCFSCGRMGHFKKFCCFEGTGWYGDDREPMEATRFGPWMNAEVNPNKIKLPSSDFFYREIQGNFRSPRRGRSVPPSPRTARGEWMKGNGKWAKFEERRTAAANSKKPTTVSPSPSNLLVATMKEEGIKPDIMEKICSLMGIDLTNLSIRPAESTLPVSASIQPTHEGCTEFPSNQPTLSRRSPPSLYQTDLYPPPRIYL